MPRQLDWALWLASRGFSVFPLIEGGVFPLFDGWQSQATADPSRIREWWAPNPVTGAVPAYNVGISTTGLICLDVDVKKNKAGYASLGQLGIDPASTFAVRTPTGGLHLYFRHTEECHNRVEFLPGLDLRGRLGLSVGPGSERPDGEYVLLNDAALAAVPEVLKPHMVRVKTDTRPTVEDDGAANVQAAVAFLCAHAPAIEGQGGDLHTYQTACRLRDRGLSEDKALELMLAYWNERCLPPWDAGELHGKVKHAYAYATGSQGRDSPGVQFNGVIAPPALQYAVRTANAPALQVSFGNVLALPDLKPRPWVVKDFLMRGAVTTLVAPGGVGKSTFALLAGLMLAGGLNLGPFETVMPAKAIITDGEDSQEELSKRLHAAMTAANVPLALAQNICLVGAEFCKHRLTEKLWADLSADSIKNLIDWAKADDIGLLVLGPLTSLHESNEDDNAAMTKVVGAAAEIARGANVAVLLVHHSGKGKMEHGDAAASRGASAIVNSSRLAYTLLPATQADADELGVARDEAWKYVGLTNCKGNYMSSQKRTTWFRKAVVPVLPKEDIMALQLADFATRRGDFLQLVRGLCEAAIRQCGTSYMPLRDVALAIRTMNVILGGQDTDTVTGRIRVACNGKGLRVTADPTGKSKADFVEIC